MSKTEELALEADEISKLVMGCNRKEAYARLKKGEMHGTDFAARLIGLMFLLAEDY